MLENRLNKNIVYESGSDEAGSGCFAGSVVAASVILPDDFYHKYLNDSKQVTAKRREVLYEVIKKEAITYSIKEVDCKTIDEINILQARFLAMDLSIKDLNPGAKYSLIDGNSFYPEYHIPYTCITNGDAKYTNISAASILAKVYRDNMMIKLHNEYPMYRWNSNKGYGTEDHRNAILKYGVTPYHRMSFLKKLLK
jgi:ribonuclease HII